jgi:ATP-dependent Lhr-like helicase
MARSSPDLTPLDAFAAQTREWFVRAFDAPTEAQAQAWPAIATGEHVLISAPTGSGKTLAAFLWALDRLAADKAAGEGERRTRLVYVSPLKALSYDIERNLRAPLQGIGADLRVAIRTGDTPQRERAQMLREPPDVLITTPESLYLMLTSRAREILRGAEWVISRTAGARCSGSGCRRRRTRWRRSGASWSVRGADVASLTPACASRST